MDPEQQKDEQLWKLAKKRADFKQSVVTYAWLNVLLWGIWWMSSGRHGHFNSFPWPAWVSIFWGLAMVLEYFSLYGWDKEDLVEKEYEKLKRKKENK